MTQVAELSELADRFGLSVGRGHVRLVIADDRKKLPHRVRRRLQRDHFTSLAEMAMKKGLSGQLKFVFTDSSVEAGAPAQANLSKEAECEVVKMTKRHGGKGISGEFEALYKPSNAENFVGSTVICIRPVPPEERSADM